MATPMQDDTLLTVTTELGVCDTVSVTGKLNFLLAKTDSTQR
jgi:hypothetical protein